MTSSASPNATWLPARGRHRAPEFGSGPSVATQDELVRPGRHAEPEEEDSLAWLGFSFR